MQLTITIDETIYSQAEQYAKFTGRDVSDVIASALKNGLPLQNRRLPDIRKMNDGEVVRLSELTMGKSDDQRLSDLLHRQQSEPLTPVERSEFDRLMDDYRFGTLVKTYALKEAVERGLRPPLKP